MPLTSKTPRSRRWRVTVSLAAVAVVASATAVAVISTANADAANCAAAWSASSVYTRDMTASNQGHNYRAKWWTQNENPTTGNGSGVWADEGTCGGGSSQPGNGPADPPPAGGFLVSQAQFQQMFASRNSFYTYAGLVAALGAYPAFTGTGSDTVRKQEAAAFLANINHETGGLQYVVEQNTANYSHYCDAGQPYGCPAGQSAYYGRGPIQLSWNFNYKAAGDALGIDLLHNPNLVQTDPAVAWKTGIWYWMTQNGPGSMTAHTAMVSGAGFGETIRSINGSLECNGRNPAQVQSRVSSYQSFAQILGVSPGGNLSC